MKQSLSISSAARHPITKAVRDPSCSDPAPRLTTHPPAPPAVNKGFCIPNNFTPDNPTPPSLPAIALAPAAQSLLNISVIPTGHDCIRTPSDTVAILACQRVVNVVERMQPQQKPQAPRKPRTCFKCCQADCKGKKSAKSCQNPCRDCGQQTCRGRNSQYPSRRCHNAWIDQELMQIDACNL